MACSKCAIHSAVVTVPALSVRLERFQSRYTLTMEWEGSLVVASLPATPGRWHEPFRMICGAGFCSLRARWSESAGTGRTLWRQLGVCAEDPQAAVAHRADGAGRTAASRPGQPGHARGATAASGRTARATRPDALGLAAAVAETDARPAQQVPAGVVGCSGWDCGVKKSLHAQEQDTEEGQRRRQAWREQVSQIDRERLVFLDESGVTTQLNASLRPGATERAGAGRRSRRTLADADSAGSPHRRRPAGPHDHRVPTTGMCSWP